MKENELAEAWNWKFQFHFVLVPLNIQAGQNFFFFKKKSDFHSVIRLKLWCELKFTWFLEISSSLVQFYSLIVAIHHIYLVQAAGGIVDPISVILYLVNLHVNWNQRINQKIDAKDWKQVDNVATGFLDWILATVKILISIVVCSRFLYFRNRASNIIMIEFNLASG